MRFGTPEGNLSISSEKDLSENIVSELFANPDATEEDGSCSFVDGVCETCEDGAIVDNDIDDDTICDNDEILGCQVEDACNYNPDATEEDGSCIYTGCTDQLACNYNENANADDGSCEYPEENYDCDGNCIADLDCLGECGGSAVEDECGECDGDGSSCAECESDSATWSINPPSFEFNGSKSFDMWIEVLHE